MDYTTNPEANMQPDASNFALLAEFYGTTTSNANETVSDLGNIRRKRGLRRNAAASFTSSHAPIPASVREALNDIDEKLNEGVLFAYSEEEPTRWRKLHESQHGELHEVLLDAGYLVQIHLLKA